MGEELDGTFLHAFAGDGTGFLDAGVVALIVDIAWGIMVMPSVEDGHVTVQKIVISFNVKFRFWPTSPGTEPRFVDSGSVLPAYAEI